MYHSDILLKKEPKSHKRLRAVANGTLKDQRQNELISKERSRDRAGTSVFLRKSVEGKGNIANRGHPRVRVRRDEHVQLRTQSSSKKGKAKDKDQGVLPTEETLQQRRTKEKPE